MNTEQGMMKMDPEMPEDRQKEIRMLLGNLDEQIDRLQKCVWEFVERVEPVLSGSVPTPGPENDKAVNPEMQTELGRILDDYAVRVVQIRGKVERAIERVEL